MQMTPLLRQKEELKSLLMKVKEESEKAGLKLSIQKTKTIAFGPITSWQIDVEKWKQWQNFIFLGSKIPADGDCSYEIRTLSLWKKGYDQPRQHIKKQRHHFADKGLCSQTFGFSSSHVWMWDLSHKHGWVLKNWCFWTPVLQKTLESPLDSKGIKPVNPKGNQSWIFIARTDAEAEPPILWPNGKSRLIGKDPDARKDWRWEEKGTTEDEMVGWHHWLNGHVFEHAPGVGDGQGGLACCSPWGLKELAMTDRLNKLTEATPPVVLCNSSPRKLIH